MAFAIVKPQFYGWLLGCFEVVSGVFSKLLLAGSVDKEHISNHSDIYVLFNIYLTL